MHTDTKTVQDTIHKTLLEGSKTASEMEGRHLTFTTDDQLFGIPIADVVQIVGIQPITRIPEFPSYAKGVINLRGSIIPLIDVRLRLGRTERKYDERTCIIVTLINKIDVGFIVDEVDAVIKIDASNILSPPTLSEDPTSTFLTGIAKIEDKVVLLISAAKLLLSGTMDLITNAQG